jgi:flavin-binding protein dodecin
VLTFDESVIIRFARTKNLREGAMEGSVYKIIDIVGTSPSSWEDAAKAAIETAGSTLEDLRVAEVVKQDVTIENGRITGYRVRLNISFKYHPGQG